MRKKEQFMPRHIKGLLAVFNLLVVLLVFSGTAAGLGGSSSVVGTVKDQSGAVVAGATVTLTNQEKNAVRTTESSASGAFAFEIVAVGEYEITVEATGFRKFVIRPVRAQVSNVTEVPVTLELGQMSSTVLVESADAAVQINTEDATLGSNFTSTQMT